MEIKGPDFPVQAGSQMRLVCNGSGAPPPEIKWLKNSAPLINDSGSNPQTYMLVNPFTLMFPHVWSGDEGNYTCVVSNILGDINATFVLVTGKSNEHIAS